MNKKRLYYKIEPNNGEPFIIDKYIQNVKDYVEAEYIEARRLGNTESNDISITISFVWLTKKEFSELPEAY